MRLLSLSEASIQKRTSTAKFARSPCTDLPGIQLELELLEGGNNAAKAKLKLEAQILEDHIRDHREQLKVIFAEQDQESEPDDDAIHRMENELGKRAEAVDTAVSD